MSMSFQRAEQPVVLKGMGAARAFLAPCVTGERSGDWWVAHVDEGVRCIHLAHHRTEGAGATRTALPTEAILGDAVQLGSAGVLVGSRAPALEAGDLARQAAVTRELAEAAEAIDVAVLNHLLFGADDCVSLRHAGLL